MSINVKNIFVIFSLLFVFSITSLHAETFDATLVWSKRVELSTPVNGIVEKVFAESGKIAAKGDVLVQLDPREFKADLAYAKASLKNADEKNKESKRELVRQQDMYDRTMLSEHDLQVAKNNSISAQAHYQKERASLTKADLNLEYSAIRAPFNAIIIDVKAVKGQVVASVVTPPTLVTVAEAQRMMAQFNVSAEKVSELVLNQGVTVFVMGNEFKGKIVKISLEPGSSQNNSYVVDAVFDSQDKILRAGLKAKVEL